MNTYKYLFGPVPSRRYGSSLGVDLAVPKTCTLNCRFCQLGPTPQTTVQRTDVPLLDDVLAELRHWLADAANATPDFITAAGSGEPTLHLRFGDLFRFIRAETACRSLLLTNGSLFFLPEVRRDAALADVVKVSLHAWDQASFERVTRPHPSLSFDAILDGFRIFRQMFSGRLDLEVFIIPGINDSDEDVQRIAGLARSFAPDAITLNTAVRPPTDSEVTACPPERLRALSAFFGPAAHEGGAEPPLVVNELTEDALIALVGRHPLSVHTLAAYFKKDEAAIHAFVAPLTRKGRLCLSESQGEWFVSGPL